MGKPIKWTEEKIAKQEALGFGRGIGAAYKPWIEVHMFSSVGVSHRTPGHITGRTHHLLSTIEQSLFLTLDWQQDVIDIREQFPLEREATRTIADKLGIKHPYYPGSDVPTVMTVDFLVTRKVQGEQSLEAFNTKHVSEAEDIRSMEKLEIQREYFSQLDIPHHLVFDKDIPEQVVSNLRWIRDTTVLELEKVPYPGYWDDMVQQMRSVLSTQMRRKTPLLEVCSQFDLHAGQTAGTGIRAARILMAQHILVPALGSPNLLNEPLCAFHLAEAASGLRLVGGHQ